MATVFTYRAICQAMDTPLRQTQRTDKYESAGIDDESTPLTAVLGNIASWITAMGSVQLIPENIIITLSTMEVESTPVTTNEVT